jgi:hypothetical protein
MQKGCRDVGNSKMEEKMKIKVKIKKLKILYILYIYITSINALDSPLISS